MKNKCRRMKKQEINKKKIIILSISIIILICTIIGILNFKDIKVFVLSKFIKLEKIEIIAEQNTLEVGEKAEIKIKYYPDNANFYSYTIESSNNDIINVENNSIVEGINKGNATVKVICNGKEAEEELSVMIKAKEITLQEEKKNIKIGEKCQIVAKIIPENASDTNLKYLSENEEIATVNELGEIQGIKEGETMIRIFNQSEEVEKEAKVIVSKKPVEKIEIDDSNVEIGKNQRYILTAIVTPDTATYKDIKWKSNNENILTIDESGIIKAKGIGKTSVFAITDNGDKQAECIFNIVNTPKENKKLYAKSRNAIRNRPDKTSKSLATTSEDEEVELLKKLDNGWVKVRNGNGIVGYSLYSLYNTTKPIPVTYNVPDTNGVKIIKNVPYLNQFSLGYPTGCEAVSATMLLKFAGYNVSTSQIVNATPTDTKGKYYDNSTNSYYGGNPFKVFVGHPSIGKSKGSYGCFAEPIVIAMKKIAGNKVKNISGCSENTLFEYINKGKPVVVWGIKNAGNPEKGVTWKYPDGSGSFEEIVGEHCFVLMGYDNNYVYLNDPSAGQNAKQLKSKFISNWKQLYSQAIIIE
ncbi:MAG TPA: Ig-like domain-containing protein [Clostridiaceae bacterium]|nr:Ig-like domain-containing protein [Clostridiaceae bacterium]